SGGLVKGCAPQGPSPARSGLTAGDTGGAWTLTMLTFSTHRRSAPVAVGWAHFTPSPDGSCDPISGAGEGRGSTVGEHMTVTVTTFPRQIREFETLWVPLASGLKLAGRMWIPTDAEQHPVPAILEYVPYRRRDVTAVRDSSMHPYVAGHGYACVRVDIRGSGDSDGVLTDEYLPTELHDGAEVIAWLAKQRWCTGAVG